MVDYTYFWGPLHVAQISEASVKSELQRYIDNYSNEFLLALFGYEFKKLYDNGIEAGTQKYLDIKNGAEYSTASGLTCKFAGLYTGTKQSPIANYIYFHYVRDLASINTGTGFKVLETKDSKSVSGNAKMLAAWNSMTEMVNHFLDFMQANREDYPEFTKHYSTSRALLELIEPINSIF